MPRNDAREREDRGGGGTKRPRAPPPPHLRPPRPPHLPSRLVPTSLSRWNLAFWNTWHSKDLEEHAADLSPRCVVSRPLFMKVRTGDDVFLSSFASPRAPPSSPSEPPSSFADAERAAEESTRSRARSVSWRDAQVVAAKSGLIPSSSLPLPPPESAGGAGAASRRREERPAPPPRPAAAVVVGGAGGGHSPGAFATPSQRDRINFEELKPLRMAGVWPPRVGEWSASEGEEGGEQEEEEEEEESTPRQSRPSRSWPRIVVLLPRWFAEESLAAGRVLTERLPLVAAEYALEAAVMEEETMARFRLHVDGCWRTKATEAKRLRKEVPAPPVGRGGSIASDDGLVSLSEARAASAEGHRDILSRKLLLAERAWRSSRELVREMREWRDEELRRRRGVGDVGGVGVGGGGRAEKRQKQRGLASVVGPTALPLAAPAAPPPTEAPSDAPSPPRQPAPPAPRRPANSLLCLRARTPRDVEALELLLPSGPVVPPGARTGGNSGRPWGSGGVWLEPYEPESALRTVEKLTKNYFRGGLGGGGGGGGSGGGGGGGGGGSTGGGGGCGEGKGIDRGGGHEGVGDAGGDSDSDVGGASPPPPTPAPTSAECSHVACSLRPTCLLPPLQESLGFYSRTGVDSYKRLALSRGIEAVRQCSSPLVDDASVAELERRGVGPETRSKIAEVVRTGALARTEAQRRDPRLLALRDLQRVHGVGPREAERLYGEPNGCRSVDDVRSKWASGELKLSSVESLGIRHFDDFEAPIPRSEVAAVERAARVAAARALELPGAPRGELETEATLRPPPTASSPAPATASSPAPAASLSSASSPARSARSPAFLEPYPGGPPAFVGAVGSYYRGRKETAGDIDLLICPPPPSPPPPSPVARSRREKERVPPSDSPDHRSFSQEAADAAAGSGAGRSRRRDGDGGDDQRHRERHQRRRYPCTRDELLTCLNRFLAEMKSLGFEIEGSMKSRERGSRSEVAGEGEREAHVAPVAFSGAIRCPPRLLPPPSAGGSGDGNRPRYRRLDVKLYARSALPTALCYFSSSSLFCRALRMWAQGAPTSAAEGAVRPLAREQARRCGAPHPEHANSFHLSDVGIEITRRGPKGSRAPAYDARGGKRRGTRASDPSAFYDPSVFVRGLECESDVFEALGLEYVPPHLRDLLGTGVGDERGS